MGKKNKAMTSQDDSREIIRKHILAIRNSGETNMFDVKTVQSIALREGYYDLANYLNDHSEEYCNFILYGDWPNT